MSKPVLPKWAIILDVFGTLLLGGGIFMLVSDGELLGTPTAELRGLATGMIVIGGLLMVPLVVAAVKRVTTS